MKNMDVSPLISIIVPIYNEEMFLNRCIESIVNQTYKSLQIILVDDGSTDRSREMCDQYAQNDKRVLVIHQENKGVSEARNEGLRNAKGDYIGFVDPDDWCEPNMFCSMLNAMEETDVDAARCNYRSVYETYKRLHVSHPNRRIVTVREALIDMDMQHVSQEQGYGEVIWNTLFKADIITKPELVLFNPDIHFGEDTDMIRRLFLKCKSILFLPDWYYNYNRQNVNSKMRMVTNDEWYDYFDRKVSFFYDNQLPEIHIMSAQKKKKEYQILAELSSYMTNLSKETKAIDEVSIIRDAFSKGKFGFGTIKRMVLLSMVKLRIPPQIVKKVWDLHR